MYRLIGITQLLILFFMSVANANNSLKIDNINTMGKISCMNLVYSVSKIHKLKSKQKNNDKNKIKPLFKNAKLSKKISKSFSSVVKQNRKNKKKPKESLEGMLSVYNKLTGQIGMVDKSFTKDCETYYKKAFKECQVFSENEKMQESCVRNSLKKRKTELANLQNRIFSI